MDEPTGEGLPPDEAFALLGNPLRISILQALWDQQDPIAPEAVPFSRLYEATTEATDSGQFNYHLNKLRGWYVNRVEGGYRLSNAGENVVRAILAGTITESPKLGPVDVPAECPFCEGTVEVSYDHEWLTFRCTDCDGAVGGEFDRGTYLHYGFPPAGIVDRDAADLVRAGHTYYDAKVTPMMDGVCPECAGTVEASLSGCEDHRSVRSEAGSGESEGESGGLCSTCDLRYQFWGTYICQHCSYARRCPAWFRVMVHPEVVSFYSDRGALPESVPFQKLTAENGPYIRRIRERQVGTDPLAAAVDVTWNDDALTVHLDEQLNVVGVEQTAG